MGCGILLWGGVRVLLWPWGGVREGTSLGWGAGYFFGVGCGILLWGGVRVLLWGGVRDTSLEWGEGYFFGVG